MALKHRESEILRRALDERRDALMAELRRDAARAREEPFGTLAGEAPDVADESVADLLADLDQAELSRDLAELRDVEAARRRLAEGHYGVCADCGIDIDFARLSANPAALRCTPCQARHEKTYGEAPASGPTP